MSPYRRNASPERSHPDDDVPGERVPLWVLVLLGALRVASAVASREVWGAEPTVFALVGALALAGLVGRPTRSDPETPRGRGKPR